MSWIIDVNLPLLINLVLFVLMLVAIAKETMDRSSLVLIIAVLSFSVVVLLQGVPIIYVFELLFGTPEDNYSNARTIMLIFSISIIAFFSQRSGLFQFVAFKVIQITKGKPSKLLIFNSMLTFAVSSILADSITAIIMIPLTVTICRTLKLDPVPFIILQAMFIKLGATVLPISSIPAILITSNQNITFMEFIPVSATISTSVALGTAITFAIIYRKSFIMPNEKQIEIFMNYSAWMFVKDKLMMIKVSIIFLLVILGFIVIPPSIAGPDTIAMVGAGFALFVNRRHGIQVMKEMDFDLLIYLLSVFVITGCLKIVGLIDLIGSYLTSLHITEPSIAFMILLWIGALASAFIDNIPITKILLSLINILMGERGSPNAKLGSIGMAIGVIWGDNLTPFGDSILPITIAGNHCVRIDPKQFLKISAITTLTQLTIVSLIILSLFNPMFMYLNFILFVGFAGIFFINLRIKKAKEEKT